jgi:LmbE family N-acetylglucosaminyl deacetylase
MPRAFAIAAHPDDIEIFMGGTFLLLGQAGYELHYMTVSNGSCGSMEHDADTTAAIRLVEAQNAAAIGGAVFHASLCRDLEIFYEPGLLARLAAVVREVAPDIILTHAPQDYMEDHMNTSRLAVSAAFARNMRNFATEPARPMIESALTIYHAQPHFNRDPLRQLVRPEIFVDVETVTERKLEMLAAHVSQKSWLDATQGMDSYLHTARAFSQEMGALSNRFALAEGWRRHHHAGYDSETADPLAAALGDRVWRDPAYGS